MKDNTSLYNFYLGSISEDFTKDEQSKISLNDIVYDFFQLTIVQLKKKTFLIFAINLMIKNNIK